MWFKRQQKNRRLYRGHVLDVKLRSDQVRKSRVRLLLLALMVPAITALFLFALWCAGEWALDKFIYENSTFAIQNVQVQTDGVIAPEQLRRWAGVKPGQNLIALDLASVKRNLELVSTIESVSLERILPRTLKISVTERRPVAQVNVPHADASVGIAVSVYQMDADGFVMQPLDPRLRTVPISQMADELPTITGLNLYQLQPGHPVESPQAQAALQLLVAFQHSPMAGLVDIRRLDVSSPGVVVATTEQGAEITFSLENFEQQLQRWREIYDLGQRMNKHIATADLAVENNVPVRWAEIDPAPVAPRHSQSANSWRKNV